MFKNIVLTSFFCFDYKNNRYILENRKYRT